jgi:predicted RNA-binding protein with PIN domain
MRLVVDAMNVIGSRPDGWWRDRAGAIERLVTELDSWAEGREEAVTVALEREPKQAIAAENVEVVWAPHAGRDAADEEIVRRLDGWLAEDEVTVITSDRDLAAQARAGGAEVESAAAFRRRLGTL